MVFNYPNIKMSEGTFIIPSAVVARANPCLDNVSIKEFWNNFTLYQSTLEMERAGGFVFLLGDAEVLPLDGGEYSINVTKGGVAISARDEKGLFNGFMTLLDRIEAIETDGKLEMAVKCFSLNETPLMERRMVHFCVFPETELWELQKFLRLCAALKYTHVVVEFWGMLKYDCMKELSWPNAYTKDEVRPILREARELGVEIIPMFNHWGHAAQSRVRYGKHVALDQNPTLQTYFSEDGWCWDIKKPKVRALLRSIRAELTELCGDGEFFHIGCDEAYNFKMTTENMDLITSYLNEICEEMAGESRRIIAWGDMFLFNYPHYNKNNRYECNATTAEISEYLLSHLDKRVIIADWEYSCAEGPVQTALDLAAHGFDTMLCPWSVSREKQNSCIDTVKNYNLFGLLHTTWHTLHEGIAYVLFAGVGGYEDVKTYGHSSATAICGALIRRVMPSKGNYEKAGWTKKQIGF